MVDELGGPRRVGDGGFLDGFGRMLDVLQGQAVHLDSQELHFFRRIFDAVDYIGIVADHIHIFFIRHVRSPSFHIIKIHCLYYTIVAGRREIF